MHSARRQSGPYLLFTLALSLFALAMLAADALFRLDPRTREIIAWLDNGVCLLFFLDFLVTFWRAEDRLGYFMRWGWLDLLSSVPMVDELRWGRVARIFRIFRILRGLRSAKLVTELVVLHRHESALLSAALITLLMVVFSAIAILQLETAPNANIRSAGDALWWSITTLTTVGYGDLYPVTGGGRVLAAAVMVAGVGLFGALSGLVASLLLRPAETRQEADLDALQDEIRALRRQLAELAAAGAAKESP
ncbi:ion transporter [Parasulfuritortus cantonensis]|uniref:Ion transporter n=1 Tax=Parasulfuritortus cantonensis TaxID=2528202 RepID=A0A4R1B4E7_9PROT|nr:ion transporter [Parasulfuritortus cantonensis]TCJ12340.1 ion transporter [Parasulfuritortus cantonensis]